jgi:hypothetical protein
MGTGNDLAALLNGEVLEVPGQAIPDAYPAVADELSDRNCRENRSSCGR